MYKDINDNELIYMINENNDYYEVMLEKYKPIIYKICYKYKNTAKKVGYELEDLIQYSNISLMLAINNYKDNYNNLFYTYAVHVIKNNILNILKQEHNNRKKVLNEAISYDEILSGMDRPLIELIEDTKMDNPLDYVLNKEIEEKYICYINSLPFDIAVAFEMRNCGFTNKEISEFLNIDKETIAKSIRYAKCKLYIN